MRSFKKTMIMVIRVEATVKAENSNDFSIDYDEQDVQYQINAELFRNYRQVGLELVEAEMDQAEMLAEEHLMHQAEVNETASDFYSQLRKSAE